MARAKGGAVDRSEMGLGEGRERARGEWNIGSERQKETERENGREKDADVVIVDASVLVHALPQVKKWCRDGREEVVIVPLEGKLPFGLSCTSHANIFYFV